VQAGRLARCVVAVAAALFLVRVLGAPWGGGFPPFFPDSASYVRVADRGPLSPRFWFDERPPAYPLAIWMFGAGRSMVVVQFAAYVLAWIWLGAVVWERLASKVTAGVTIAVLALVAIQARWALWTTQLLTESLSVTLSVAAVAAWWQFFADPRRWRIVVAASVVAGWMLLRDANAITFTVFAVPAAVAAALLARRVPGDRRRYTAIALAALVAVGAYSAIGQAASDRGETSFHNNVGMRWLLDDGMTGFFESRGMPLDAALRERAGSDAWADGEAFLRDPALADYRDWAAGRGRMAAAESLVLKAPYWLDRLWSETGRYLRDDHVAYDLFDVGDRVPRRTLGPLDPVGSRPSLAVAALVSTAAAIVVARRAAPYGWLAGLLLVPAWIDLYVSFAGDAIEVGRHLVGPLLRLAVAMIVVTAIAVDALLGGPARQDEERAVEVTEPAGSEAVQCPV
jgi:hypothetical protein